MRKGDFDLGASLLDEANPDHAQLIAEIADDVLVMFRGRTVEYDSVLNIFERPQHPYTKGLLACRPQLESAYRRLPTVADFMETKEAGGTTRVGIAQFAHGGGGVALHGEQSRGALVMYYKDSGSVRFFGQNGDVLREIAARDLRGSK